MKVMGEGLTGGTSFMEDYTYHLHPSGSKVLGSHMLEICESIAEAKPHLEIHPLGIGGKEDPLRLVFDVAPGNAINLSLIDLGNRFRMILNEVKVEQAPQPMPKLPVARAVWVPQPNFKTGCEAWILAGGAHHTGFSQSLTREHIEDFAEIAGLELLGIGAETRIPDFKKEIRWNEISYHLAPQLGAVR
jgi:L-arabinose isomerase